jgi:hypothetical protein
MNKLLFLGEILYQSMTYIKGKLPTKVLSKKIRNEVYEYVKLWDLILLAMLNENNEISDNITIEKVINYIYSNKLLNSKIVIPEIKDAVVYFKKPYKALHMMITLLLEINIELSKKHIDLVIIDNDIRALHNLPRCLISPNSKTYITEDEAINYANEYLKSI